MQRGSLRGHHEEKQVMSSVGSEADVVGEDWKPGVSWKRREVTWFACCVGRQGGVGRTLRSPLCFLLLERKASQGKTWLRPGRVCGVPVLGSVVGEDPSRGMEAEFQPSPSPCLLAACAGAPGPLPPLGPGNAGLVPALEAAPGSVPPRSGTSAIPASCVVSTRVLNGHST